jgi:polar amino acid transport system substrate-binding protein
VSALVPTASSIVAMVDLSGERVCLTSGAFFNRRLVEDLGVQPRLYRGTRGALIALKTGACAAYAYDDTALKQVLLQPGWAEFRLLKPSIDVTDWVVAVPLGTGDDTLGRAIALTLDDWHRTGFLLAEEARWGLDCSPALVRAYVERGGTLAGTPDACRGVPEAALAAPPEPVPAKVEAGWSAYHVDLVLRGLVVTALLSVASIIGALAVGLAGAFLAHALPGGIVRPLGHIAVVFQTTPPLLQLYIVFFGLGPLIGQALGVAVPALAVAVVVFSLYAGAAVAGLLVHTAGARGVRTTAALRAALPAVVDDAYAGIVAHLVNIVKAVGMASVIAVPEVVNALTTVAAERSETGGLMTALLVFYLGFVWLVLRALLHARRGLVGWMQRSSTA